MTAVDYDDPCALLAVLRPAYYALLAGEQVQVVSFTAGGVTKSVTYKQGSTERLASEIARLQSECARARGQAAQRFAMPTGGGVY